MCLRSDATSPGIGPIRSGLAAAVVAAATLFAPHSACADELLDYLDARGLDTLAAMRIEELAVGRWLMVAPTLGGESRWFADGGGATSLPGTLTFTTRRGSWWGLEVVRPTEQP